MLSLSPSLRFRNEVAVQSIPSVIRSLPSDLALVAMAQSLSDARQVIASQNDTIASLRCQLACSRMREDLSI